MVVGSDEGGIALGCTGSEGGHVSDGSGCKLKEQDLASKYEVGLWSWILAERGMNHVRGGGY